MNETNMSLDRNVVSEHDDVIYPAAFPFLLVHLSCIAAIWSGITWQAIAICAGLYWLRMFAKLQFRIEGKIDIAAIRSAASRKAALEAIRSMASAARAESQEQPLSLMLIPLTQVSLDVVC
jgi:hypothetical protein